MNRLDFCYDGRPRTPQKSPYFAFKFVDAEKREQLEMRDEVTKDRVVLEETRSIGLRILKNIILLTLRYPLRSKL